ncbi:VOC family protein [Xanthobacteraceae bacterium Astr-EGSB]|uniref:VOC family protein n=1 Tax=Astrobacterium formosum TaxID=3069710 RepID=UPI0027B6C0A4|nr:VOC family protein [Xanthobacteraceae bacterium Astr-EGSB]
MNKAAGPSMKLRCINIVSANPERLVTFYRTILGANADDSHGGPRRIEMWFGENQAASHENKPVFIVINRDEGFTPRISNSCRGFELHVSDANAEYTRIQALGVEVKEPPKDLPWGFRFFNIEDPDGNSIDIVQAL